MVRLLVGVVGHLSGDLLVGDAFKMEELTRVLVILVVESARGRAVGLAEEAVGLTGH